MSGLISSRKLLFNLLQEGLKVLELNVFLKSVNPHEFERILETRCYKLKKFKVRIYAKDYSKDKPQLYLSKCRDLHINIE